ncbi:MAG: gliding motility-associated C-terminal domain-containing protein [Flavobacteriales bacterium]|nr:gliding motility-associated C-terminal domain-containing protein [Flavobacteriales bacterium]
MGTHTKGKVEVFGLSDQVFDGAVIEVVVVVVGDYDGIDAWQVFDFDNETGTAEFSFQAGVPNVDFSTGYGVEFSPSSRYLYWNYFVFQATIERFDLAADDPVASRAAIANASVQTFAALQLGPDGFIYAARSNGAPFLSRIEAPDAVSPADVAFVDQAISLPGNSLLGLPTNWTMKNEVASEDIDLEREICPGSQTVLDDSLWNGDAYLWSTGQTTPSIEVSEAGEYTVDIDMVCFNRSQTYEVSVLPEPVFTQPDTFSICEGETTQVDLLTDDEVLWSDGGTGSIRTIDINGPFEFIVTKGDCSKPGALSVLPALLPAIELSTFEFSICEGSSLVVAPEFTHADSISWSDGSTQDFIRVDKESSLSVKAFNDCGAVEQEISVTVEECHCPLFLPNAFTPNRDGINDVFKAETPCRSKAFELVIFNRWGEEVFYTNDISQGWIGGKDYYAPNTFYQYRYSATLEKNGEIFFREGTGHLQSIR